MIQLRIRTEYTFGSTFAPINRCIDRLKALGVTAAGIVDPNTWGHVAWDKACRAAGIKPLFGLQIAVVPNLETEDRPSMWFIARSSAGLQELYRFSSLACRQAHRGAARLTYDDVRRMSRNIHKFAGQVIDGPLLREIGAWIDLDPALPQMNKRKFRLSNELVLAEVPVSDNAYATIADKLAFEMLDGGTKITPQHILAPGEMAAMCTEAGARYERAMRHAQDVADACEDVHLPKAPIIQLQGDLEALCREGIYHRGFCEIPGCNAESKPWTPIYEARLQRELELIRSKKFESYFLMVADMVRFAKQHMLVGPSRGSAAGSLVCYLSRITEVDPIPAELIFERFIDVTRNDLPDIDLDFPDNKRELVIQYLRDKYGKENVAHIGTVSRFKPKSALAAVGKRLGIPPWEFDGVKDSIFERSSGDSRANFSLLDTLEQTEPGRKLLEKFPAVRLAADIEAHASHSGVHAAGILVCNDAVENYCTVTADGVAQVDKKDAEKLNLLKIDILGLRTLGVLEDSGVKVDWYNLPFNDPATFKLLNAGRFAGIFQFEGLSLQSVAGQMTINSINDIGDVTALARPGPMASGGATQYLVRRAGKEKFRTPHPLMDKYVKDTYGIVVYQEQVIQICREIGKLNWEDTTSIRKAMSRRLGVEFFNKFQSVFVKGAAEEGIDEAAAKEIWSQINTMGCLSGRTVLQNPFPNHATPKRFTLAALARNNGYIRKRAPEGKWDIIKRQQLYALNPRTDTIAPVRCTGAVPSGKAKTLELRVASGERIRATLDHKFLTQRGWRALENLQVGVDRLAMIGATAPTARKAKKGTGSGGHNWWPKAKAGGELFARNVRILRAKFRICMNCRHAPYQETHHVNGNHEDHRLRNLMPVCRGCHRRLHGASIPHSKGKQVRWAQLIARGSPRVEKVYDARMPADVQNFVANGFIVHNSWAFNLAHSYSYAVVSYWTAWLKANHLLQFAAATLRNAKDDESSIKLLRELTKEGVGYIPFDPDKSEINWSVKEGRLYGGFIALKGIGESKAQALIKERTSNGGLPPARRAELLALPNAFADPFPTESRFGDWYANPEAHGVRAGSKVVRIEEIKGEAEFVYIGQLVGKDLRDHNEEIRVKRRNGKRWRGPTLFLDLDIEDDTGKVLTRIERYDFEEIGRPIWEKAQPGTWWLVRAERKLWGRPDGGFRMTYVKKIMQLQDPKEKK